MYVKIYEIKDIQWIDLVRNNYSNIGDKVVIPVHCTYKRKDKTNN